MERKVEWPVYVGLLLAGLLLIGAFVHLPYFQPLPVFGALPDFSLTNQNHETVTLDSLRGKVWIADVIFTRCAGECPIMSAHMRQIQDQIPAGLPVKLVSFTTDPAFDTPEVLKKYGERFGSREGQWIFLTGSKADLRRATVDGMKLAVLDKPSTERDYNDDLFIHSQKLVVIDQTGRIRGYFDGETADGTTKALAAAKKLARS